MPEQTNQSDFQNPFEELPEENLDQAIDRLQSISSRLVKEAFSQAAKLTTDKEKEKEHKEAQEIKKTLLLARECRWQISEALEKRILENECSSDQTEQQHLIRHKCNFQENTVGVGLGRICDSLNTYESYYPNAAPHLLVRTGSMASVLVTTWTMIQVFLSSHQNLSKIVMGGVFGVSLLTFYFREFTSAAKSIVPHSERNQNSTEVPYYKTAAKEIAELSKKSQTMRTPATPRRNYQVQIYG